MKSEKVVIIIEAEVNLDLLGVIQQSPTQPQYVGESPAQGLAKDIKDFIDVNLSHIEKCRVLVAAQEAGV